MKSEALRSGVWQANLALGSSGLVKSTFGNVSGVDRAAGVFAIKPSGVPYDALQPEHMVLVSLETGAVVDGDLRPSSDTPTHLELYRAFPCGGVAHTHSEHATALAQARLPLRCLGTTHADYFRGDVPVTREMTRAEVDSLMDERMRRYENAQLGAKAIVASTKKVGGPGTRLDIPITHINASYVRSHFDAVEVGMTDSPRADEILLALVMTTGPRVHARVGGLKASDIKGEDGLR